MSADGLNSSRTTDALSNEKEVTSEIFSNPLKASSSCFET